MVAKFVVILCAVAMAAGSDLSSFSYGVADPYTGDFKSQTETRANGNVAGQYSLLDSDGTRRTVDYAAGAGGFNAVVRKDPAFYAAAPAIAAPISYAAAPAIAAPISYAAAPAIAAPLAYNAYPYAKFGAYPYAKFGAYPYATPYAAYPRFF